MAQNHIAKYEFQNKYNPCNLKITGVIQWWSAEGSNPRPPD